MRIRSTKPDKLAEPRYAYGDVEAALAYALGLDFESDSQRSLLRSRVKHFKRLGASGLRSRRGAPVAYAFTHAAKFAIALLLADGGLAPVPIVQVIETYWEKSPPQRSLLYMVRRALEPGTDKNPWWLALRVEAMRGPWARQSPVATIGGFQRLHLRPPLSEEQTEDLRKRLSNESQFQAYLTELLAPRENIDTWLEHPERGNVCIFPLSHTLHRLRASLEGAAGKGSSNQNQKDNRNGRLF